MKKKNKQDTCSHTDLIPIGVDEGYIIERCLDCFLLIRTRIKWDTDNA